MINAESQHVMFLIVDLLVKLSLTALSGSACSTDNSNCKLSTRTAHLIPKGAQLHKLPDT